ncbi:unnamed protein product [Trichobilharzia regenti]|nr:unnamed protein product [Trichobilharzia regenti]
MFFLFSLSVFFGLLLLFIVPIGKQLVLFMLYAVYKEKAMDIPKGIKRINWIVHKIDEFCSELESYEFEAAYQVIGQLFDLLIKEITKINYMPVKADW